jgi:hypothetical protein
MKRESLNSLIAASSRQALFRIRAHYEAIKTNIKFQKMENGLHCQGREGQRDTETRGNSSYSPHAGDPIFKARIETLNSIMNEITFPCLSVVIVVFLNIFIYNNIFLYIFKINKLKY